MQYAILYQVGLSYMQVNAYDGKLKYASLHFEVTDYDIILKR